MTLLTVERIQEILDENGIGVEATFFDDIYAQVDEDWVVGEFKESFSDFRDKYQIGYQEKAFDCENFSRIYSGWADIRHARTPGHPVSGVAIGTLAYTRDVDGMGHGINIAICNNSKLVFVEPQTGNKITLTETEKWNALDCRF